MVLDVGLRDPCPLPAPAEHHCGHRAPAMETLDSGAERSKVWPHDRDRGTNAGHILSPPQGQGLQDAGLWDPFLALNPPPSLRPPTDSRGANKKKGQQQGGLTLRPPSQGTGTALKVIPPPAEGAPRRHMGVTASTVGVDPIHQGSTSSSDSKALQTGTRVGSQLPVPPRGQGRPSSWEDAGFRGLLQLSVR